MTQITVPTSQEIEEFTRSTFDSSENISFSTSRADRIYDALRTISEQDLFRSFFGHILDFYEVTASHCARGGMIATDLFLEDFAMTEIEVPKEVLNPLETMLAAGFLHDFGKINLSLALVSRTDGYSAQERALMRTHTQLTYVALERLDRIYPLARNIAAHHHDNGGNGYATHQKRAHTPPKTDLIRRRSPEVVDPWVIRGRQILELADKLDASASKRPYRKTPLTNAEVVSYIQGKFTDEVDLVDYVVRTYLSGDERTLAEAPQQDGTGQLKLKF
ncbi:HD domain-containing protein [Candidatus Woesearchaeota archaeon]|jgi:hypothetical protein|nr:HD domain-containing protein [Candidatus Woesearchaeota archaeon]MBT3537416.1 HD domain-containing protein [Candidatus Woesearchaeota archaeon]MBT4697783.1 HD domain-containing protein [Candidatus Woesearchaeota archaeon]MBT4717530.1 HD domain-containing protein [Candidatus Woesearchaeota archaeon]MBT7106274.1 HD domain-containing protein [Candidatus Woesearchaeota archaeon]